jgi:cbb3-type cytochrome oxidase maturation protein
MSVLIFLIPLALLLSLVGLLSFLWALKNKQYDDLEGSSNRILFDESKEKKD